MTTIATLPTAAYIAECAREAQADNARRNAAEARLRERFAAYMADDLDKPATLTHTAGQVLEDALGYRDFMQRALAILVKCPEAQGLLAEVAAHWAAREAE